MALHDARLDSKFEPETPYGIPMDTPSGTVQIAPAPDLRQVSISGSADRVSSAPLATENSFISNLTSNLAARAAKKTFLENLKEKLRHTREQRNPHLPEDEQIKEHIDAVLNPNYQRYGDDKSIDEEAYKQERQRQLNNLGFTTERHVHITEEADTMGDLNDCARRMEYGSVEPIEKITGASPPTSLSPYKQFVEFVDRTAPGAKQQPKPIITVGNNKYDYDRFRNSDHSPASLEKRLNELREERQE